MKYLVLFIAFATIVSCNGNQTKNTEKKPETIYIEGNDSDKTAEKQAFTGKKDVCWEGKLGGKTPVFLHYQLIDQVVIGEITYLNTKSKTPIKLAGTMEADHSCRFLEFDKTGNITGVMTCQIDEKMLMGTWYSPKSGKELEISLRASDSIVKSVDASMNQKDLTGEYRYQFGVEGYAGSFILDGVKKDSYSFGIESVTGEPARNLASVMTDTIRIKGTQFDYALPESDNCEFKVRLFRDFVFIDYTKGSCVGDFGHNATVEGIYLKVK